MKNPTLIDLINQIEKYLETTNYNEIKIHCESLISKCSDENSDYIHDEISFSMLSKVRTELEKMIEEMTKPVSAYIWEKLGNIYYLICQFEQAIKCYNKSIEFDEFYASSWHSLGWAFINQKRYKSAVEYIKKSIELDESDYNKWNSLGSVYCDHLRQYEIASECFKKSIELNESVAYLWNNLGTVYLHLEQYEQAIEYYRKSLKLDDSSAYPWNGLGLIYTDLKDYEQAIDCFNKSIKLNKSYSAPWNGLGLIYGELNEYEQAIECFGKSIDLNDANASAWNNFGRLYCDKLRQYEKAVECFKKSIDLNDTDASTWYNLGNTFLKAGDNIQAHENFAVFENITIDINKYASTLLDFYTDFHAPFLLKRIFIKLGNIDTFISYRQLLKSTLLDCKDIETVIQKLILEKNFQKTRNFLTTEVLIGILTHYMNDPVIAYKIFSEEVDPQYPEDLMGQYYFIRSCSNYPLAEKEVVMLVALEKAENFYELKRKRIDKTSNLSMNPEDCLQIYYAGMIFKFCDFPEQAINCFNLIDNYLPSFFMKLGCLDDLELLTETNENFQQLLTFEHNHEGILNLSEYPPIDLKEDSFYEQLVKFIHIKEIQDIIPILLNLLPDSDDIKSKLTACCHLEFKDGISFTETSASSLTLQKQELENLIIESIQGFLEECFSSSFSILKKFSGEELVDMPTKLTTPCRSNLQHFCRHV